MKWFLILSLSISTVFGAETCITTGDCSRETVSDIGCLIVKTGVDASGMLTCRKQCFNVQRGFVCKKFKCVLEKVPNPNFDPNDPAACRRAIEI